MSNYVSDAEFAGSAEQQSKEAKTLRKMVTLITQTEENFKTYRADELIRNLSYYRGEFWGGDGYSSQINPTSSRNYAAVQNEVFPIIDTIASSLAMDLPQVEAIDQRAMSYKVPERHQDATFAGKRVAAALNFFAEEDQLDDILREMILHALLFDMSVLKVMWSSDLGRPIWRTKLPWEVHFDPNAKRAADSAWAFERFVLHIDDLRDRIDSGVYNKVKKTIKGDTYPRSLVHSHMKDEAEIKLREAGLKEYVSLVEYWDFKRNKLYHLHPDTNQLLMESEIPYGRPYEVLVFHPGIGRIRGIPDTTLVAPIQRDINELVSARREIVARLPRRMLVDSKLFRSEEEFERWKNARTWEPTLIHAPPDGNIDSNIWVSPEMKTTFDFNNHLSQAIDSIRWLPGMADYQQGQVKNIRTAAEANMIRSAIEGRLAIRSRKVVRIVTSMFRRALDAFKWALVNKEFSGVNVDRLSRLLQVDVDAATFEREIVEASPAFRLLPFSPLMEDKITRRAHLIELISYLSSGGPLSDAIDQQELAREVVEAFGFRPSLVKTETVDELVALQESVSPEAQAIEEMAAMGGSPEMPPMGMPPIPQG
tara:strand:+ start:4868 stop:6649 length:1782 start_codon:yes stop_codon:yes gene_type:complete